MQGSYKNNGLPRPYYMKPTRRGSAYDKLPRTMFYTRSRKLMGYIVMLALFGLCVFMIGKEFRPQPDSSYELLSTGGSTTHKNSGDVDRLVDSVKVEDKATEKLDLAENKAQNSKGEYGHAVLEAPKGGVVNEGPIVGNDEGLVIDGKKKAAAAKAESTSGNGVKAVRGNGEEKKEAKASEKIPVEGKIAVSDRKPVQAEDPDLDSKPAKKPAKKPAAKPDAGSKPDDQAAPSVGKKTAQQVQKILDEAD